MPRQATKEERRKISFILVPTIIEIKAGIIFRARRKTTATAITLRMRCLPRVRRETD